MPQPERKPMVRFAAKVSVPEMPGYLRRRALFDRLDAAGGCPLIWVAAPAGAGKTTLGVSYVRDRKLPALWHQLDAGDGDPATFFHYLSAAARAATPDERPELPRLTPEYTPGIFARRFFQALCGGSTPPAMIVFDDFHEVPGGSPLPDLLAEAVEAVPKGVTVMVLSRTPPPPALARLRAGRRMAEIGWEDIRLTAGETAAMAALVRGADAIPEEVADGLYRRTGGWAAGVVLLAGESGPGATDPLLEPGSASQQAVFDYFAHEVYARLDQRVREILLRCALPPRISHSAASALCGGPDAGPHLARLAESRFFVHRHSERPVVYQFHPLFRQFLLERGSLDLPPEERADLLTRVADLLTGEEAYEDAAACLMEAGAAGPLARLVLTVAPRLAAEGRLTPLRAWLDALPAGTVAENPWLSYFHGASRVLMDPLAARAAYGTAFEWFKQEGDLNGQFLAWAGVAETFLFLWRDFWQLDRWMDELERMSRQAPALPPETELRTAAVLMFPVSWRFPGHPLMAQWCARAERMFDTLPDPSLSALLASLLLMRYGWSGHFFRMERLIEATREAVCDGHVEPALSATWRGAEAEYHWMHGRYEEAQAAAERGVDIATTHGAPGQLHLLHAFAAYPALAAGNLEGAAPHIKANARLSPPELQVQHGQALYLQGWQRLLAGDPAGAVASARQSLEVDTAAGAPFAQAMCHSLLAQAFAVLGKTDPGVEHLAQLDALALDTGFPLLRYHHGVIAAWLALRQDDRPKAHAALRETLALGAAMGLAGVQPMYPQVMTQVCAEALAHGIESDYARKVVRTCRLHPSDPDAAPVEWPWPVRVTTLGRFSVELDGAPLASSRKPKKKTLELLRALIASGPDGATGNWLCSRLWPDAEGDAARQSLRTAVHRLRSLIGRGPVVAEDGRVRLDARAVWVDAWAVDRLLSRLAGEGLEVSQRLADAEQVARLYRGGFLSGAADAPWELTFGDRLRRRMRRVMAGLHASAGSERIEAVLHALLEADPASEELARALMRCRTENIHPGTAVFKRLQVASGLKGRAPSPETGASARKMTAD